MLAVNGRNRAFTMVLVYISISKDIDIYIYSCSHIQFSGPYIRLLDAILLGHLTDDEKMVLLQTRDQLKPH